MRTSVYARQLCGIGMASVATLISACREPTAPSIVVLVGLYQIDGPTFSTDSAGFPVISCTGELSAQATGDGSATWADASYYLYAGVDRSMPVDRGEIPAATVQQVWGQARVSPGNSLLSRWRVSGDTPFSVTFVFHYQVDRGHSDSAQASFACGPDSLRNAASPAIGSFSADTARPLQPGQTLTLHYEASSAVGLWATVVRLAGACSAALVQVDSLQLDLARTLTVPIPDSCPLGGRLAIGLTVLDAAFDQANAAIRLPALVDATPPTAWLEVSPRNGDWAAPSYAFFVGDTLTARLYGTDDHALGMLYWEVLPWGARDSVAVSGKSAMPLVRIVLQPGWTGPLQLSVTARDSSGNVSAPFTTDTNLVQVYVDATGGAPTGSVAGAVSDVAYDAGRGLIYALQPDSSRIVAFSIGTMAVAGTIPLPARPTGFDRSVSGDSLIATLTNGHLAIVDLRAAPPSVSETSITPLDSMPGWAPAAVRVVVTGVALVTAFPSDVGDGRLISIDLASGAQRIRSDAGSAGHTGYAKMARAADGSALLLNAGGVLQRYSAATDAFGPTISMDPNLAPTLDAAGDRGAIGYDVLDAALQVVSVVADRSGGQYPKPVLSPDGATYYVDEPEVAIVRSRTSDGSPIDRIPTPLQVTLLTTSPDGTILVAVESSASISRIHLIDLSRLTPAAGAPRSARR